MKTCLIVDDSRVVRKIARRIIEEMDFECSEAEDGEEALEACKQSMPDSVLLDWNMPNMSGMDFLKALKVMEGGDKPKVIFCTAESDMSCISEAISNGAHEYIMKPFDNEILKTKFAQVGFLPD